MTAPTYIGNLRENPSDLAWRVQRLIPDVSVIIWLNEWDDVFAAPRGDMIGVPPDSIVGIYLPSHVLPAIEADIDAMKNRSI